MGSNREKSILLSQYWKNNPFSRVKKIISHFDGSNNIFADCRIIIFLSLTILFVRLVRVHEQKGPKSPDENI